MKGNERPTPRRLTTRSGPYIISNVPASEVARQPMGEHASRNTKLGECAGRQCGRRQRTPVGQTHADHEDVHPHIGHEHLRPRPSNQDRRQRSSHAAGARGCAAVGRRVHTFGCRLSRNSGMKTMRSRVSHGSDLGPTMMSESHLGAPRTAGTQTSCMGQAVPWCSTGARTGCVGRGRLARRTWGGYGRSDRTR